MREIKNCPYCGIASNRPANPIPYCSPRVGLYLATAIEHYKEYITRNGVPEDRVAAEQSLADPAVQEYLGKMHALSLLPLERNKLSR